MFSVDRSFTYWLILLGFLFFIAPSSAHGQWEEGITTVIQMGDSYSAGFGVLGTDVPAPPDGQTHCDDLQYQAAAFTPGFRLASYIQSQVDHSVSFVFEACGGAEVYYTRRDLADQWQEVKNHLPELGTGEGALIVMTFGGNDVRARIGWDWPTVVANCITNPTGCNEYPYGYQIQVANLEEIAFEFAVTLADIVSEVPEAIVRVLGYPIPFQPVHELLVIPQPPFPALPIRRCPGMTGLSVSEADFLDGEAGALNDHLQLAVELADQTTVVDMRFVDVEDGFHGHGACNVTDPFVNDVDWVSAFNIQANSLHPLASGWDVYFATLLGSLEP